MYRYIPIEEERYAPEMGRYRTYGISVENEAGETVAVVSDVSTDQQMVSELTKRCTNGELAPEHLLDVILNHI